MATIAEIKINNNTLIRVKTTAKSITKANVADQLDAGLDFTAQEIATVNNSLVKTNGSVLAISGSKATLQYDINSVNKAGGSDVKLPTTTLVGKEVLFLASNYSGTVSVYVNDAEDVKLSGGANGISGTQQSLQINPNEAYRFIYRTNDYWYFEKIIDIPTNYYQLISERTTDGTLATNSNFKYPTEQAVKTYVDSKSVGFTYDKYVALLSQTGTSAPTVNYIFENTIGTIVWTRSGTGAYLGTLSNAFPFDKTWVLVNQSKAGKHITFEFINNSTVRIYTLTSSDANEDDILSLTPIEIRVYN